MLYARQLILFHAFLNNQGKGSKIRCLKQLLMDFGKILFITSLVKIFWATKLFDVLSAPDFCLCSLQKHKKNIGTRRGGHELATVARRPAFDDSYW